MLDRLTIERVAAQRMPCVLALSGGGDSVALLLALVEALGAGALHACVVDHAVRPGSHADAQRAAGFAQSLGVTAEVLPLTWPEGVRPTQARMRRARYAALCTAARRLSAGVVVTGHTADDQAETVLMRAAAGSAWRGLAGMAPIASAPVWPEGRGLLLARPLLGVRRTALRALLRARGADWIEDPANANTAYARVRVRARLAALEAGGFDTQRLVRFAARLRAHADELDQAALALIGRAARFEGERMVLGLAAWIASDDIRRRALSVLLAAAAGAEVEPSPAAVVRLDARLAAPSFGGAALGGARLQPRGRDLVIERDPGAVFGRGGVAARAPLELPADVETVWDGRLAVTARGRSWRVLATRDGPKLQRGEAGPLFDPGEAAHATWLLHGRVRHALAPGA